MDDPKMITPEETILRALSAHMKLPPTQTDAVVKLIDEGNTIPFIARYRKEQTGALDDQQLRELSEKLAYLRNLEKRRAEIGEALAAQNVTDEAVLASLAAAATLAELEDVYRPYRPKRRTRATIAKERGLEPLADRLWLQVPADDPETLADAYIDAEKGVNDTAEALAGARDILAERISDDAEARGALRRLAWREGVLTSKQAKEEDSVYRLYYAFSEPVSRLPGHRILAINRGEREEFLKVSVDIPQESALRALHLAFVTGESPMSVQVRMAADDGWDRLIAPSLERELRATLTERASEGAIRVFAANLQQLLMQPPVKGRVTLGVDPGFRTGCKLAVIDGNGKVLETGVGYFTLEHHNIGQAEKQVSGLIRKHNVTAIAIGNGTASRESERFIVNILGSLRDQGYDCAAYMIVNEAGASVYSASKVAADEFPQFDVTLRSAVSIARRMLDPLAELVKIEPRSIGVGQYQHDIPVAQLDEALDGVVERCVNLVGVEAATASAALLKRVAGIGPALAQNIVAYQLENGPLQSRAQLKKVPKLGPKAFEQCAGFLRITGGKQVLDATGVHPESYAAAQALLEACDYSLADVRAGAIGELPDRVSAQGESTLAQRCGVGIPTLRDIVRELLKPGRDPRDELPPPLLRTDVLDMEDLQPGMKLAGTIRNVIDFGAFVDIGVHQDGLVHISRLCDRFVRHPSEIVKVGDVVDVWVVEVDVAKKRIALTMVEPK